MDVSFFVAHSTPVVARVPWHFAFSVEEKCGIATLTHCPIRQTCSFVD